MAEDPVENDHEWDRLRFRDDEEMDFFTELALHETERWIQAVTRKKFDYADDFRKSLSNGVLLCELLNNIKPGAIKRINKLPGAIAGLDNITVFLAACEKSFGLNDTQLFDPSDLEDLSNRAIADENEYLLKQETDRRSRNVAVTIYWLGREVSNTFKGPALDTSAFSALVHSHGNKNIITNDCFKNGNSRVTQENPKNNNSTHIRDSSYDSLGSYERESESSFDELDHSGNMPVRSDMREMRRYNSASSLSMPRDLKLSTASHDSVYSDDKQDSMYQSSPDLSQGDLSLPHTRSSSTDSAEGGYYGNHSRQSSGSTGEYPARRKSTSARKVSTSTPDPLQFVKLAGAQSLAQTAKKQMEVAKEVNMMRGKVDASSVSEEPDWQSNFNNWKSRRKSTHSHVLDDVPMEEKEEESRKIKPFSQIMAEKQRRSGMGLAHIYPLDDDDSGIGINKPRDKPVSNSSQKPTEKKSHKIDDVAPWARDSSGEDNSQSDSETNNSHQSGDTDSVFSDKSTPSKLLSDDDSWTKKQNSQFVPSKVTPLRTQKADNVSKLWESNVNESQRKDDRKMKDIPTKNSAKIKDITKTFEQKDKDAHSSPTIVKRQRSSDGMPPWKSLDLTDGSSHRFSTNERKPTSPLSPNTPKSLLPRDQRFHHNDQANVDILPNMEKLSVSQSPRDRYLQNVSPVHQTSKPTTKTFGSFTSPTSSNVINKSAMGPKISAKPAKSKILAAKAMFEKSNEEELSLPNPGKRKNQNNRNNMYDTTEDKTVNKNPHIGDINFGETVCEQENHFEEGTTENKEIIHENVDTADHELGFELTKDPSYICEHAEIAVKCVEIEDTLFPSREVHTENIIVCNDIDNISNIAEEAVANALETIVAQELEYVNSEFLHEVDQEDGYQHADLTHMVNVQNPVCVEDRSDVNVQKPVCAEDDTASSCDDASEDQVQSEEQKDVSDDDFDVPEYNPCDEQRVVQERSEELLSNEDLVRDQLLEDVTVNDDVDGEDVTVNDNVDGLVDEQSENNDNNQDGESEVEDDSDVQDLCNAYEHVLFEAVENDEEVETYEADLFDIDEVDEANFVPDLPKSQIPPDLPRSQIPDIIESNSKDLSFESDVSDTLRPDSNMGVEQNDILLIDGPAIQNMAVEEEEKDCSPWIEEQSNSSVPLIGDCHFDLNMGDNESGDSDGDPKKFVEKVIKISQRPNNNRGFGFTLVGGMEKRQPVTVQRVSLGSAADVQDVLANDELTEVNGKDVATLTLAQVQGIVDHAVKRGQIELKIKRFAEDESYDSMEEEEANMQSNNNRSGGMDVQSDSSLSADPPSLEEQHVSQILLKTDETGKPRLMDQLIGEKQRETNNNEKNVRAPSPVSVEPPATVEIALTNETIPSRQLSINARDICAPTDVTLTEDRSTITVRRSTANYESDHSPVVMRRERTPLQSSPAPPTPPRNEPPPLSKANNTMNSDGDSSGFGPPAALMRWQRPRAKSEYQNPFPSLSSSTREQDRFKRLSSTLPYSSAHTFSFDKDYSKDDTEVDKVSKDFVETVSVTKPLESNPNSYQFNDTSRIEEWQQKQDQQRMPKPYQPIELHIPKEENLTAQSAAPARKVAQIDAPDLGEINVQKYEAPLSPQDKFEKDQQRIRQRYEDEKKKAKQSEQFKQTQERQVLNSDKFMQSMESQIMQTKQEAANQNLLNSAPIREPRFTSEPMKMKIPANSQGRPLMIDPRNQADSGDNQLPEYSFRVDLSKTESAPPLRTLNTQQDISPEQLLERERERIREEEKQKLDEERQQWLQEQERQKNEQERKLREKEEKIRQEQERLQREQERVEHERALLEQKKAHEESLTPRYQPVNNTSLYLDSRSPTGSSSSSISPTSRHSAPALDPKHHESSRRVPPPTAPKPDKGAKEKARLTREDLLAMNRKATPLTKPDSLEPSGHNDSLSPTTREAPSKRELHSLNAVPKPKFHSSAAWMKDTEDTVPTTNSKYSDTQQNEKPFVIGKRSDLIHQRDYSNPSDHWLVREAEKRRLADKRDNVESVTAHAGPTKPSQSSLVSRFRSDIEPPPRRNRFSYPSSQFGDPRDVPSRPLSTSGSNLRDRNPEKGITTQFSARSQPSTFASNSSLSQTLPPSFSFNANARNHNAAPLSKPPRSLTDDSDPVIAVNGKQKCSHCGEELGFGAAMVIESLGLYYHVQCFRCCVCHMALGNGSEGADVRVRVDKLHCKNCYSNDEAGLKFSKV